MDVLKLKKSPLNAYKSLMEWHLREKGEIEYYENLKDCRSYISREVILKKTERPVQFQEQIPVQKKDQAPSVWDGYPPNFALGASGHSGLAH